MTSLSRGYGEDRRTRRQSRPPSWLERRDGFVDVGVAGNDQVNPKKVDEKRNFMKRNIDFCLTLRRFTLDRVKLHSIHSCFIEKDCNFAA